MSLLPRKINEIQSLRAFSIISIILYHSDIYIFNKDLFRAGFLGVDVFLVISGYLIFKSLDTENITKNFWISLKNFYFKRVKRILPLLIIVIFFTNFFSIYLLSFYDYLKFYKSINSALFFYSNWFFETNNTN